tara:strand:- start:9651 stop:10073 length:423 start_codon:yes stop_codon:yes gene_type:complete
VTRKVKFERLINIDHKLVFKEISNFENYVNYVPGCTNAELVERTDNYEVGRLEFNLLFKNYTITSKNYISDNKIKIEQIDGPFISFEGKWKVLEKDKNITKIIFTANFELPRILDSLLSDKNINLFFKSSLEGFVDKISG